MDEQTCRSSGAWIECLDQPINITRLGRCRCISIETTSQHFFGGRVLCQLLIATHSLRARESETACTTRM